MVQLIYASATRDQKNPKKFRKFYEEAMYRYLYFVCLTIFYMFNQNKYPKGMSKMLIRLLEFDFVENLSWSCAKKLLAP